VLAAPTDMVEAPAQRRVVQVGGVPALIALVGLLPAVIRRRISRSIAALSHSAEAVARRGGAAVPDSPVTELHKVQRAADVLADRTADRELLLAREQARRREAEAIADIGRSLTEGLDAEAVSQKIAEHARALLGALAATLYRFIELTAELEMVALSGDIGPTFRPQSFRLKAGEGIASLAVRERHAIVSANIVEDPQVVLTPDFRQAVERSSYRAAMAVPLVAQSRVLGVFAVVDRVGRQFSAADVQLAERFAAHAAIALNNAELYEAQRAARHAAQATAARAKLLAEASRLLAASLDYDAALTQVAELITLGMADWCSVYLIRRDGSLRRVAAACSDPSRRHLLTEFERHMPPLSGEHVQLLMSGEPIHLPEVSNGVLESVIAEPDYLRLVRELGPRSVIIATVRARRRFLGFVVLVRTRGGDSFTREDVDFATDLATRAAIAVDNSRLYRQAERARSEAEAASRAKDEFLAMLGHELRNPLAAITNAATILNIVGAREERAVRAGEVISRQVRHLAALVDDLLDVARVTAGKIALTRRPLDLADTVRRVLATLDPGRRGPSPTIEADLRGVWIHADETRAEQIVSNLVANALKFTPPDGVVHVTVEPHESHAQLTVRDTGIGIPRDLLPRVFDLFVQGARTADRSQGGLGIGLTLVRRLVELHGGAVTASSAGPGHGSRFTVRLPAIAAPTPPALVKEWDASPRRFRILVVEDNPDARDTLEQALKLQGHEVTSAADGPTGLDRALSEGFDAAVIDIGLPGLDGYEVARRIRANDERDAMVLVAVTGYAQDEDRQRARAAGFDDHLPKPIEPDGLIALIAKRAARLRGPQSPA
jgi:signal transduction histidine kinase/ActR/RegA family two-component response regulator